MKSRVSSSLTACVAMAGAGVIALTPAVAAPPTPPRIVEAATALTANFTGMNQVELAAEFGKRVSEQVAQAPFIALVIAAQIAGNDKERLYSQIRQIVDAPVYVIDPLIEAVAITVPKALGGGSDHWTGNPPGPTEDVDGAIVQFRNTELLGVRDAINAQVAGVLGVSPTVLNENYVWTLTQAVQESADRFARGSALGAAGIVPIAQAIVTGDNVALYEAVREYVDAPLWAADPAIEGLANALPASLGGDTDNNPRNTNTGAIMQFRNTQLIGARNSVRVAVAKALDVDVDSNGDVVTTPSIRTGQSELNRLKPHVTSLAAANPAGQLDDAGDKAEKRSDRARAKVGGALKKVKSAAGNTARKLGAKKPDSQD